MGVCKAQTHVEELPKLLKWAHVPQGCENMNPGPNIHFSKAGISLLYCLQCVQNAEEGSDWGFAALLAECGRMMYDSQSSEEWSSHFTITGEIIIPWPQTQRQPYQQELGFSKHVWEGMFSQHFSNVTYLISISFLGSAWAGNADLLPTFWSINLWTASTFRLSCGVVMPFLFWSENNACFAVRWPNICF